MGSLNGKGAGPWELATWKQHYPKCWGGEKVHISVSIQSLELLRAEAGYKKWPRIWGLEYPGSFQTRIWTLEFWNLTIQKGPVCSNGHSSNIPFIPMVGLKKSEHFHGLTSNMLLWPFGRNEGIPVVIPQKFHASYFHFKETKACCLAIHTSHAIFWPFGRNRASLWLFN